MLGKRAWNMHVCESKRSCALWNLCFLEMSLPLELFRVTAAATTVLSDSCPCWRAHCCVAVLARQHKLEPIVFHICCATLQDCCHQPYKASASAARTSCWPSRDTLATACEFYLAYAASQQRDTASCTLNGRRIHAFKRTRACARRLMLRPLFTCHESW
jgi:hypothetical protein